MEVDTLLDGYCEMTSRFSVSTSIYEYVNATLSFFIKPIPNIIAPCALRTLHSLCSVLKYKNNNIQCKYIDLIIIIII